MSEAVKLIVDTLVGLKDRRAIEEMRDHRQGLRRKLQERDGRPFSLDSAIGVMDSDLHEIEAGLARLQ